MKKINKFIIVFMVAISAFLIGNINLSAKATHAEDLSNYNNYYVVKKEYWNGTSFSQNASDPKFIDGDAFLLKDSERVSAVLGDDNNVDEIKFSEELRRITYKITINDGVVFDNQPESSLASYGIQIPYINNKEQGVALQMVFNPSVAKENGGEFIYGKYAIEYSFYYVDNNLDSQHVSFTSTMYILRFEDYKSSTNYLNLTNVSGDYVSNYSTKDLPYMQYGYKNFNLQIARVFKGVSITTSLTYNGKLNVSSIDDSGNVSNEHCVTLTINKDKACLTFKNLGAYYIVFEPINPNGANEKITKFYNETLNLNQRVYVYGFQANYTDKDGLIEFKLTNEKNGVATNSNPWEIESISYSADVTSYVVDSKAEAELDKTKLSDINPSGIAKTNQAPIYFDTNATLAMSGSKYLSKYYYFKNDAIFDAKKAGLLEPTAEDEGFYYIQSNYASEPLSQSGIYLVELVYTYSNLITTPQKQFFLFKLTNDAPKVEIFTQENLEDEATKKTLNNDEFTNKSVFITKSSMDVFDAKSVLMVYKDSSFSGTYDAGIEVLENQKSVFETTARYKVELKYGNNNQKGFITYFTIDKEEISEIVFNSLHKIIGSEYFIKSQLTAPYVTNGPISLSWKPKTSGATIVAEYKFFPTNYSLTNVNSLTSTELRTLYESNQFKFSIPSTHILNYNGGEIPSDEYYNTYGKTSLMESEILQEGGLYIFKLYDNTGAEPKYFTLFIDTTPNSIITINKDNYQLATSNEVVSEDKTMYFGKNKLIKINADITSSLDTWLANYLSDENSITYKNKKYLTIALNNKVYYSINSSLKTSLVLSEEEKNYNGLTIKNYGITIPSIISGSSNDNQYIFYTISSTTNKFSNHVQDSFDFYKENYTGTHTVRFTTDNSRISAFYIKNGNSYELTQALTQSPNPNTKINYFEPASNNLFDVLYLSYCVKPNEKMTVESVAINYYPFIKSGSTKEPTYKFSTTAIKILLYENGVNKQGSAVSGQTNTYLYEINKEEVDGISARTKAGKYEIIRKYSADSVLLENDPTERKQIFIVDRNGLISEPDISANGDATYYVGSGIMLQVAGTFGPNYFDGSSIPFYDIYYATKLNKNMLTPVLKTNFLPVTVYIPKYKYGYISKDQNGYPNFVIENSIVKYSANSEGKPFYYDNYVLSATIDHYRDQNLSSWIKQIKFGGDSGTLKQNFLTTEGNNTIYSFKEEGYYLVTIKSNGGDEFSFVFQIEFQPPEYSVLDTDNTPITSDRSNSNIYYTNKKTIRISWEDSASKYLARINKQEITYSINGNVYHFDVNKIIDDGNNKYHFDLDLGAGYYHGSTIDITLQYNGNAKDYLDHTYFSKTVSIVVDLEAPIVNLNSLVYTTGLSFNDLRDYVDGKKYNTSKTEGDLRYFAFTLDVKSFTEFIKNAQDINFDYYKLYYKRFIKNGLNTKYVAGNLYETDITTTDLTGQTDGVLGITTGTSITSILKQENYNTYIEFIEEDYAGNRTVYTIYLSAIENNQEEVLFKYKNLTNSNANAGQTSKDFLVKDLQKSINLYSKRSFNLKYLNFVYNTDIDNLSWQIINVLGTTYVKSPYTLDKYFSLTNRQKLLSLSEVTELYSSSNSQKIDIFMVPTLTSISLNVYVLNKTLNIYTLSQVNQSNLVEGLLVEIPNGKETEKNQLYATNLSIKAIMGEINQSYPSIEEKYLKQEQEELPSYGNMILSYTSYRGGRYLQIEFTNGISLNDYFIYTIVDNFGEEYKVVHIFGQTDIAEPILGEGTIVESYDETGSLVYYSSESIEYRYDTTIYKELIVTVSNSGNAIIEGEQYNIKNGVVYKGDIIQDKTDYEKYFEIHKYDNVMCIKMNHTPYDFANGLYGGSRFFTLTLVAKDDFDLEDQKIKFNIFNELPNTLKLFSKDSAVDVTSILGGKTAYAGEVIINYIYKKLAHEYEILLVNVDGDIVALTDETVISEDGTYTIIINYLGDITGCSKAFNFTIANSNKFVYSISVKQSDGTYKNASTTGSAFTYEDGDSKVSIATHYIVNDEYEILLNSNLYLKQWIVEGPIDGYTYIHKISNLETEEAVNGLISEFYSTQIAVTVVPKTSEIIKRMIHYGGNLKEKGEDILSLSIPAITPYVTTKEEYEDGIRIAWSKYNLIPENKIYVSIYYGDIEGVQLSTKIEEQDDSSLSTISLKTSGTYYLKFTDMAGNTQLFGAYKDNEYFTVKYLSSVIFEIDGQTPINHAIYNNSVTVSIPELTLSYYDVNAKPVISVELNGEPYNNYTKFEGNVWEFSEHGLYKIWFTAKIDEKTIYQAPIFFTILSSEESRLSYTYSSYGSYYIQDVKLEGESVNSKLANINSGDIVNINKENFLKSLSLHANDYKTGSGHWTFVVCTNNEFNQMFEFTIWINKAQVPIKLSVENGASTTDEIIVSFNTKNIINESGDCIVKITGFADLVLTKEKLSSNELEEIYNLTITKAGNYYIEVTTLSGQLLYSSYVTKVEPLNTVSIIIIVAVVLVVGAGIVLFILLRKRMKIR